jgi:hypothetical protein
MENIDLEEGKIRIKGEWFTEDEIRYAIRMKVESDDYNVADLAVALKTLISEMNKSTILKVRVPKELAEGFDDISQKKGESVESMLRTLLIEFITKERRKTSEPTHEDSEDEVEAEIVDVVQEEEPDEDYIDEDIESELLDMESSTIDSDEVKVEEEPEDEVTDMDDFENELEEVIREFTPTPKEKKTGKKVLRRKKLRTKKQ